MSWFQKWANLVCLPPFVLEVLSSEVEGIASKPYIPFLLKVVDLSYGWVWSLHHLRMKNLHVWSHSSYNEIFTYTPLWIGEELAFCHVFLHVFCLHIFLVVVQGSKMDAWCWRVLAHLHMDMNNINEFFLNATQREWTKMELERLFTNDAINKDEHHCTYSQFWNFFKSLSKNLAFLCLCCYPKWKSLLLHCQIWIAYWVVMESCYNNGATIDIAITCTCALIFCNSIAFHKLKYFQAL